jgi:hypothetical protein
LLVDVISGDVHVQQTSYNIKHFSFLISGIEVLCQIVMRSFGYGTLSGRQITSVLQGIYYLLQGYQL